VTRSETIGERSVHSLRATDKPGSISAVAETKKWIDQDLNEVNPVEACKELLAAIEASTLTNWDAPENYADWQSYARNRDKKIDALASAVVTLLKLEKARAREAQAES
jgi:hypothetical protein